MSGHESVLEARATALARPVDVPGSDFHELVVLRVGDERYAIEAQSVWAVFRLEAMVRLPGAPVPVQAVSTWNGRPLALVDLQAMLGLAPMARDDLCYVLVVGHVQPGFGVLVDAVEGVRHVPVEDIHPLPGGLGLRAELVQGALPDATLVLASDALLVLDS